LILQTDHVGLFFFVKIAQGIVWRQNLSILALMAFGGAVDAGFTCVGNLCDGGMALGAAELAVRRIEIFFFVDVEHFESVSFFMPHQSGVLVAGKAAAFVQGYTVTCCQKN
jgi:hypothetical protein